ncbi:MAG: Gldg family protein [Chitinophagaceae bacterium]|nr:Gldg family protein [Chitinophagaceae bacterium]
MKKIWSIAKNELYSLFYSPIAWIMFVIFMVMIGVSYIRVLDMFFVAEKQGGFSLFFVEHLTHDITVHGAVGYLTWELQTLYVFFPLLTMGLISREKNNGTIKLLYSSPVKIRDIILGKYLAMMVVTLCFIIICAITMMAMSFSIENPDYVQLTGSLIALFLLLSTYAAIGLFFSSLTPYQIVAAIFTFACLAFLSKADSLWQEMDMVRDITYYLNIGKRSMPLIGGLFSVRNICYLLIISIGFICFTIFRTMAATESIPSWKKVMRYGIVILLGLFAGYITSRPSVNAYLDLTRDQFHTITPPTQEVLAKMNEGPLEVTIYANLLNFAFASNFKPSMENETSSNLFERYSRFKHDIKVNFVYYYAVAPDSYNFNIYKGCTLRQIAEKVAGSMRIDINRFLTPEEIRKQVDIESESLDNFMVFKYKDRSAIVRTYDDNDFWPLEDEMTAGFKSMLMEQPLIAFLSDGITRRPFSEQVRDYTDLAGRKKSRESLINQGYRFDTVSLEKQPVPQNIAGLVIADVRKPLSPTCLERINQYIENGGNLFLTVEPDRKQAVAPILEKLGLKYRDGMLIQPQDNNSSDVINTYLTDQAIHLSPRFERTIYEDHRAFLDSVYRVILGGSGSFDYVQKDGFLMEPLLRTDPKLCWNRLQPVKPDSMHFKLTKLPDDETGTFIPALKLKRTVKGREQRIFVVADADFPTSNYTNIFNPKQYNFKFGFWCLSQFSYGRYPANTVRPLAKDNKFRIDAKNILVQKKIMVWVIPILIALAGSFILIRRKRK